MATAKEHHDITFIVKLHHDITYNKKTTHNVKILLQQSSIDINKLTSPIIISFNNIL